MTDFLHRYGPWAVIAGASEGIGEAFALALAKKGVNLVLVARRADVLADVERRIRGAAPVDVRCVALDLGREDAAASLGSAVADLDVGLVVYNAARSSVGEFLAIPVDAHLGAIDVNARGPVAVAHLFGNRMAARGRGGIVLLSSLTAFQGSPYVASYGATKAFNLALAEGLWFELAPRGVDVLAVCAGATRTPGYLKRSTKAAPGELDPAQVADEALAQLRRGPFMIPGRFNRFASLLMRRLLPRRMTISIMGGQTRNLSSAS